MGEMILFIQSLKSLAEDKNVTIYW